MLSPMAGSLHPRALIFNPWPHEAVHWDQVPHSCHSEAAILSDKNIITITLEEVD